MVRREAWAALVDKVPGLEADPGTAFCPAGTAFGVLGTGCGADSGSVWARLRAGDSPNARINRRKASRLNIKRSIQRPEAKPADARTGSNSESKHGCKGTLLGERDTWTRIGSRKGQVHQKVKSNNPLWGLRRASYFWRKMARDERMVAPGFLFLCRAADGHYSGVYPLLHRGTPYVYFRVHFSRYPNVTH